MYGGVKLIANSIDISSKKGTTCNAAQFPEFQMTDTRSAASGNTRNLGRDTLPLRTLLAILATPGMCPGPHFNI